VNLDGRNPDETEPNIIYEKGYLFLRMLEEQIGRDPWDRFLRSYFATFAFQTMTTERFLSHLRESIVAGDSTLEHRLRLDEWVYGTGLPPNPPEIVSMGFRTVETAAQHWLAGTGPDSSITNGWKTQQWIHFLRTLRPQLDARKMSLLDARYRFTYRGNAEILHQWLVMAVANGYTSADSVLEDFLHHIGRLRFLEPIYAELGKSPQGLARAQSFYRKARPGYHAVSSSRLDKVLNWKE
jgi:hypothetical protein